MGNMADSSCTVELKEIIENMNDELGQSHTKISELDAKVRRQEEGLLAAQKEMAKLQEENVRLSRDLKEENARLARDLKEENTRLARDLKESEERCRAVQERLEFAEQKLAQFSLVQVNETNDDALGINSLPDEIILEAFGYLTQNELGQIARVCRRWNVLSKSRVLWKNVNVRIFPSRRSQTTVANLLINRLPSCVTSIRLNFTNYEKSLDFEEICPRLQEKCPNLEELILIHSVSFNSLPAVINICTQFLQHVKNLVFIECIFLDYSAREEYFGISKIEILGLFYCYFDCSNKSPFSKMPHLKQLHLRGTNVQDFSFLNDASFLNQLHVLNVGRTYIKFRIFPLIQNHGLNLKELYLCSHLLQDYDLNFNYSAFPHLKTICIAYTWVTCEGVVSLIQSCPSLENVYVTQYVARCFAEHPFVVANRCKSGIVKAIHWNHNHNVDYLHN